MSQDAIFGVVVLGSIVVSLLIGGSFAAVKWWLERRELARDNHLPLYERLANAEEREGNRQISFGNTENARRHFREAQTIRREATDAMMRGEEPKL